MEDYFPKWVLFKKFQPFRMFQGRRDMIRGPFTADLHDGNIPSHITNMEMNNTSTNGLGITYVPKLHNKYLPEKLSSFGLESCEKDS